MGSGKAKKARKAVFNEGKSPESLPPQQRRYILKEIDKVVRNFEKVTKNKNIINTPRAFPCQKLKGQFVYLKDSDIPEFNKDDGLWYLNGELLVSDYYKYKIMHEEQLKLEKIARVNALQTEKNIKELKPQTLGDA